MKYCSNNINTLNYSLGWFKTKQCNGIMLLSIYLESFNTVTEGVELSIFNNYVVLRAILNKDKLKDVELMIY